MMYHSNVNQPDWFSPISQQGLESLIACNGFSRNIEQLKHTGEIRTSVKARLYEHSYGFDAKLKVFRSDVGGITNDEGKRIHALDEGLCVMQTHVLS